jgi:predicted PurR-regulated permease PerM
METYKVPRALAVILVTFALVAIIVGLLLLLSTPISYWVGRASELGALLKERLQTVQQPLAMLDEVRKALNAVTSGSESGIRIEQQSTVFSTIFAVLTPTVSQFILFIGALVFYLAYQKRTGTPPSSSCATRNRD